MGTKRPLEDMDGHDAASPEPQTQRPSTKRFKHNGQGKHKAKEGSVEWMKKRARGIERRFQRDQDLPANIRNDLERELHAHKATIADRSFQKKRSTMISKYHMVRFFERKKAMRLVKQIKRKMNETTDEQEKKNLEKSLHIAEVDEAYAVNHPHAETYISLYSKSDEAEQAEGQGATAKLALNLERPPMWSTVEAAMEQGPDALKRLRERRSHSGANESTSSKLAKKPGHEGQKISDDSRPPKRPKPVPNTAGMNRRERRKLMRNTLPDINKSDDEGEGGFFEED